MNTLSKQRRYWVVNWHCKQTDKRKRTRLGDVENMPKREAERAFARFNEGLAEIERRAGAHTVGELWARWLKDRADDGLSNAIYAQNWKALAPHFEHLKPASVDKQACKDYARARFDAGRAPWTVWTEMSRLRACLSWAHKRAQLIDAPVFVWVPPKGRPRTTVLSPDDMCKLVAASAASAPHVELFIVIVLCTGARHTAILDLTWDRVDFAGGVIHFDDQPERDPLSRAWRKGRASVPMNELVRSALLRAFEGRQCEHVVEHGGKRLKSVGDGFANAVMRAGLPPTVTPHVIRHSIATMLDESGYAVSRIGALLGHAPGSKVTRASYIHNNAYALLDAVAALDFKR